MIDNTQGFSGEGLTATRPTVRGGYVPVRPAQPGIKIGKTGKTASTVATTVVNAGGMRRAAASGVVGLHQHGSDADAQKIQRARNVESMGNRVFQGQFFGMLGGGALGWVAKKMGKTQAKTVIDAIFIAPFDALMETPISKLHHLPKNYMAKVSSYAKAAEGTAANDWAPKAAAKAQKLGIAGDKFAQDVKTKAAPALTPVKDVIRNGIGKFERTSVGGSLRNQIEKVTDWRATQKIKAHHSGLGKAETALTYESVGLLSRITNFFTGKGPKHLGFHPELAEVTGHINAAKAATTTAERATHMTNAKTSLEALRQATQDASLLERAANVEKHLLKSERAITSALHFEGLRGQSLTTMVKSLGRAAGNVKVFGAIAAVAGVAGITATVMTHRHESKLVRESRAEIEQAIGRSNPLMASIARAYGKESGRRAARTVLSVGGDIGNTALMMTNHVGMGAILGTAVVPMVGQMLIPENPMLNAYAVLRRAEKTGAALPPETKIQCIAQLVAAVPSVKSQGGIYNRLTVPVAEEILDSNLSATDTIKLLASERQFSALATKVLERQQALSAPVAANAAQKQDAAPAADAQAAKPTAIIRNIAHEGQVVNMHHAQAV